MPQQLAAMPAKIAKLNSTIERAVADGKLMELSAANIRTLVAGAQSDLYLQAVDELVAAGKWSELNDRFYQALAFGTGGLRGRTIGKTVTAAERGSSREDERPEFPCVGTNASTSVARPRDWLHTYTIGIGARKFQRSRKS